VPNLRLESWRALEAMVDDGLIRSIGVSNFMLRHLQEFADNVRILPAVNQIELSPYNYAWRRPVVEWCAKHGIVVEAYSPLTKGLKLKDPPLVAIAQRHGRSTAQVLIRWVLEKGCVALPKSVTPARIIANAQVFDFKLTPDDMATLDGLNENLVTGWDPTDNV
jgi:diketogulonate reductase-like aldo/keto reductase